MTKEELNQLYAETGTKQRDFRAWAKKKGVVISAATTSQHVNGHNPIPGAYALAYKWFFSHYLDLRK